MRTNATSLDLLEACRRLAEAAETFANRAPRQKRIEAECSALFDALAHAQLVLSVTRLQVTDKGPSKREKLKRETTGLEEQLKRSLGELAKSRHALEQLDWLMQPVTASLDDLQDKAKQAQTIVKTTLNSPARVLPFRKLK